MRTKGEPPLGTMAEEGPQEEGHVEAGLPQACAAAVSLERIAVHLPAGQPAADGHVGRKPQNSLVALAG